MISRTGRNYATREANSLEDLNATLQIAEPITARVLMEERTLAADAVDLSWWDHPIDTATLFGKVPDGRGRLFANGTAPRKGLFTLPVVGGGLRASYVRYHSMPGIDFSADALERAPKGAMTADEALRHPVLLALADHDRFLLNNYVNAAFRIGEMLGYDRMLAIHLPREGDGPLLWPVRFESAYRSRAAISAKRPPSRLRRHFLMQEA